MRKAALALTLVALAACNRQRTYESPPVASGSAQDTWVADANDLSPEQVRTVQRALADRGFVVEPSGRFDDQTKMALNDFQRSRGLPETGNLSADTAAALGIDPNEVMPVRGSDETQILGLAAAFVVHAGARADAAEVEAQRAEAALHERARQRLHDLVVHGAGKQRMRVRDHRDAAQGLLLLRGSPRRLVAQHFNGTGRAVQHKPLCGSIHRSEKSSKKKRKKQKENPALICETKNRDSRFAWRCRPIHLPAPGGASSRSTTRPFFKCDSTISSMSS